MTEKEKLIVPIIEVCPCLLYTSRSRCKPRYLTSLDQRKYVLPIRSCLTVSYTHLQRQIVFSSYISDHIPHFIKSLGHIQKCYCVYFIFFQSSFSHIRDIMHLLSSWGFIAKSKSVGWNYWSETIEEQFFKQFTYNWRQV